VKRLKNKTRKYEIKLKSAKKIERKKEKQVKKVQLVISPGMGHFLGGFGFGSQLLMLMLVLMLALMLLFLLVGIAIAFRVISR